ncbi:NHL domain-containing protein [Saccharothrix algeriensis]|uniref:Ricin B lectin domain-containing protein n=1 Tax=Saccharothrix algeriensis TaxID=173560 RepID=A0ABS2SEI9_9PSEU|nr:RICIN domain-containing protein [Saccharothrix algeriensis]MBM7814681.1 hypothetical protein [Saccharothrix algeriensis]
MSTAQAAAADPHTSTLPITTVAGNGAAGFGGDSGPATSAHVNYPLSVVVDGAGDLYIADHNNHRIRKVARDGTITTAAGNGTAGFSGDGGPATSARVSYPVGLAVDGAGSLYIADYNNHRIRKVAKDGTITTVAGNGTAGFGGDGGPATSARLNYPYTVAVDGAGSLYIADYNNHRIRKVAKDGTITTAAGTGAAGFGGDNGPATSALLNNPTGVAVDDAGNLYVADYNNHRIRKVTEDGTITTAAGTGAAGFGGDEGPAASARLHHPIGVAVDGAGNLYVADYNNHRIRKVAEDGTITTAAGTGAAGFGGDGGPAASARLNCPYSMAVDGAGSLYVADRANHRIRKVTAAPAAGLPSSGSVVTWVNARSRLRLEVFRESTGEGAEVHQSLPAARGHQRWRLTVVGRDGGDDLYIIENVKSGKVLEVVGAQVAEGVVVVQRTYGGAGARHQQWRLEPVGSEAADPRAYRIVNRNSGLFLGVGTNARTAVKQFGARDDDRDQQWQLVPV